MVFLGGPRQVGKATLALDILGGDEMHPAYFNLDYPEDKRDLLKSRLPADKPLFGVVCKYGDNELSKHIAYFAARTDIPNFYQVHAGTKDDGVADSRARVLPLTVFAAEVLKVLVF
jgi:hypothetical protein